MPVFQSLLPVGWKPPSQRRSARRARTRPCQAVLCPFSNRFSQSDGNLRLSGEARVGRERALTKPSYSRFPIASPSQTETSVSAEKCASGVNAPLSSRFVPVFQSLPPVGRKPPSQRRSARRARTRPCQVVLCPFSNRFSQSDGNLRLSGEARVGRERALVKPFYARFPIASPSRTTETSVSAEKCASGVNAPLSSRFMPVFQSLPPVGRKPPSQRRSARQVRTRPSR